MIAKGATLLVEQVGNGFIVSEKDPYDGRMPALPDRMVFETDESMCTFIKEHFKPKTLVSDEKLKTSNPDRINCGY